MQTQAHRFTNEKLLEILSLSQNATAIYTGEDLIIQTANDMMTGFWGKDRNVIGKPLVQAVPELVGQPFIGLLENVWRTGISYEAKNTVAELMVDGKLQTFYFDFVYQAIRNEREEIDCILHTATDVTELNSSREIAARATDQQHALEREQNLNRELAAANENLGISNKELYQTQFSLQQLNDELEARVNKRTRELTESEHKYRSLIGQSPIAQQVFRGEDMTLELVNETMLQFLGKGADIIGKPLFQAVPEIVGQPIVEHLYRVYRTGVPLELNEEKVVLHRNGRDETGWYNVSYRALYENNSITGILGIAIDVTQQVLARQALEESEMRFRSLIENSPAAMLVFRGEDLVFETVNGAMLQILDKSTDIIGKPLLEGLPEIKGQPIVDIIKEVYRTGVPYTTEGIPIDLYRNGKLESGYFNGTYRPLYENGFVTGILQAAVEVTGLFRAHQEVRESEEKLKMAVETAKMGTWSIALDTMQISMSPFVMDLLGLPADEEPKMEAVMQAIDKQYHPLLNQALSGAIHHQTTSDMEYSVHNLITGELRWVRATGRVFGGGVTGRPLEYTGMFMDITEQKQDDQRKNDFIGMVSHELKTPLTTINGYLQILKAKAKKADDRLAVGMFEKTSQQVQKMTTMINGFLNVSRLESGKIQIERQRFDMALLVKETEEESIATISSHKVEFAPVVETWVNADRDKIAHVISNLISNAVKYSPTGSTIKVACVTQEGMALVSVQDEGMGISAEDLPKLFERYYRVKDVQTTTIAGFGIGLYLCCEIIKRHEGDIWAESEVGKGSTFYFSLPVVN